MNEIIYQYLPCINGFAAWRGAGLLPTKPQTKYKLLINTNMSNEETNPASCQTAVSRGRCFGRTHEMVLEIKKALEKRGECGVGLMKDATEVLKRLKDLGVNARAEPTFRTMPPMIKRNELGEPVDLLLNEKVQTGMVFYLC